MLASLCSRLRRAHFSSLTSAARAPRMRLAAMLMPTPLLQRSTPRSKLPATTSLATTKAYSGVIDRLGGMRAEIGELIAVLDQPILERLLHLETAVIASESDPARCLFGG